MPVYHITTINTFRNRYIIEANSLEEAYDLILIDQPEELSQVHIDESIVDGRQISESEFKRLLIQVQNESKTYQGLDNSHLGKKIIHRADLSKG